jgi:hypothetical protein
MHGTILYTGQGAQFDKVGHGNHDHHLALLESPAVEVAVHARGLLLTGSNEMA